MNNIKDKLIEIAKEAIASNAEVFEDNCVTLYDNDFDNACEDIADEIIEKLPELLADSEWVKLPCKVGGEVWFIIHSGFCEFNINIKPRIANEIILNEAGVKIHSVGDKSIEDIEWGYIGDTVFLTKAEAEAKLAEIKGAKK